MTERFNNFFDILMKYEGGYVNNPSDSGGETKYGISRKAYPNVDIRYLTIEQAKSIYFDDYYLKLNIQNIEDKKLAWQIFDFGVNAGVSRAAKMIQVLVGVNPDGKIWTKSLAKINAFAGDVPLWILYVGERVKYYLTLAEQNSKNKKFLKGWILRTLQL